MTYRLAIFDFDGTLADSFPWFLRVVNEAARVHRFRRIEPGDAEPLRGLDARRIIEHVGLPLWKLPLVARWMRRRMAADIGSIALFPGVDEMLRQLSEDGVRIAIVSSNSPANVRRVLGPENAARVAFYGCGVSLFGKRRKLRKVLAGSGVAAAEALCIGDEIRDLHAARAEGIAFGAVAWGYTTAAGLAAHHPEMLFTRVDEIAGRLGLPRDESPAV
ncbi:HAD hydrolase-like protein [Longimicrobium sp.]|uniref:HAD hydrolase-like protein n=1 Tax=Longimicrobium sp. TaxID=2029185 RepID=UPI002CEB9AAC|nr:HAD hydrolase-like protein [Longimicrobium sp.]HSU15669.1 HAD hydrolase-like protein [Longimicrobium sp.]